MMCYYFDLFSILNSSPLAAVVTYFLLCTLLQYHGLVYGTIYYDYFAPTHGEVGKLIYYTTSHGIDYYKTMCALIDFSLLKLYHIPVRLWNVVCIVSQKNRREFLSPFDCALPKNYFTSCSSFCFLNFLYFSK